MYTSEEMEALKAREKEKAETGRKRKGQKYGVVEVRRSIY